MINNNKGHSFRRIGPYQRNVDQPTATQYGPKLFGTPAALSPYSSLLQHLIILQHQIGWISPDAQQWLATQFSTSIAEIRAVISFYSFLESEPPALYRLQLSTNITDMFLGQQDNLRRLQSINPEILDLSTTSCTGLCDQGPAALINGFPLVNLTPDRLSAVINNVTQQKPLAEWPNEWFEVKDNIRLKQALLQWDYTPGEALNRAMIMGADNFLQVLQQSQLRGRGGAGFATASKWLFCKNAPSDKKYVVCNADEGEPGTFKDRVLLTRYLKQVVEGMTIGALVVGADQGFIYLRGEYLYLYDAIHAELQQLRDQNLLGKSVQGKDGFNFDVEIHLGAGAYICGEESALIESLEGKRGIPRIRPPFPVTHGYQQKPTIVNNVETFYCVAWIANAKDSSEPFSKMGCEGSTGNKLHSISGDCDAPGIYEFPFGISIKDALEQCGGINAQAVQVGGPSGRLIGAEQFDLTLDFNTVSSGGSFMVIGEHRNLFDVCENFTRFFQHESCGFCTPCRVGTSVLVSGLDNIKNQRHNRENDERLTETCSLMHQASHCGLGTTASNPVEQLKALRPEVFNFSEQALLKIDTVQLTTD